MQPVSDIGRTIRTLARLTPGQVTARVRRMAFARSLERSTLPLRFVPPLNGGPYGPPARWPAAPNRAAHVTSDHHPVEDVRRGRLTLAGHDVDLGDDWSSWSAAAQLPMLSQYHLHYLNWTWSLSGESDAGAQVVRALRSWYHHHPLGHRPAWDPYPTALRAWNLCAMDHALGLLEQMPELSRLLDDHARLLRLLLERDLGGNHLIADLKGLVGLAVWRADTASLTWAMRELDRALRTQILADGGHEERSPPYHAHVLADVLDIRDLLVSSDLPVPHYLSRTVWEMQAWLRAMAAPDGTLPIFSDGDRIPAVVVTEQLVEGWEAPTGPLTKHLAASGFVVARPSPDVCLVVDVGPPGPHHQPGHSHAGIGSFDLWVRGQRVFRNTGSSTYSPGARRDHERSSGAQNTLTLDGQNQSEMWASFRVGRSPDVVAYVPGPATDTFFVEHDGFQTSAGPVQHRRTFRLSDEGLVIDDAVSGSGSVAMTARLHTPVTVAPGPLGGFRLGPVEVAWPNPDVEISSENTRLADGLGRLDEGNTLVASCRSSLSATMRTTIRWDA